MTVQKCKLLRDAQGVWCEGCDREISGLPLEDPWWGINKVKAMHERGTGHKCFYVRIVDTATTPALPEVPR